MKPDLTEGPITELIKKMALPAAIGLFFQAMYNATDAYYVGQVSVTALAAVSVSFPIYFLILSIGGGISVAANALASKARGEKNTLQAKNIAMQSILFTIFLSIIAGIIGVVTSEAVFDAIGARGELNILAVEYMNVIYYGLIFFFLTMALNGLLNSIGDTKTFGYALVFGFFLNIILDPWFMYGGFGIPAMGVAGVAFATVVTQIITTLILGYQVLKRDLLDVKEFLFFNSCKSQSDLLEFKINRIRPNIKTWAKIASQAVPVALQHASVSIGFLIITKFVSDFGENAIATFGIGTRIDQLVVLPAIGIAISVVPIVGQNFGAKKFGRIIETYKKALEYSTLFLVVSILLVFIFADNLAGIFTTNKEVITGTAYYLRITAIAYAATAIAIISGAVLQGLAKAHLSLMFAFLRFFVITIPAIMIFAYFLNLKEIGIWIAILVAGIIVAIFGYWYVMREIKKIKNTVVNKN